MFRGSALGESAKVVARYSLTRHHTGEFMGVQATSKYVTTGIDIYLLNNGKIKEHWHEIDMERLMMQLFR